MVENTYRSEQLGELQRQLKHQHHPVVFGAVMGLLGVSLEDTQLAFMFSVLRTILASAVRLDYIGAMEVSQNNSNKKRGKRFTLHA